MSVEEIGCCGAYCKTCKPLKEFVCNGCKLGYVSGERDINKAKCKIKVCCIKHGYNTCADCSQYTCCEILNEFYGKKGYKYGRYKKANDFIREKGYEKFLEISDFGITHTADMNSIAS